MRGDTRLRSELAYVVPLGIPHSTFLAWSEDDQDKALAWQADRSHHCPRCQTREDEWDPERGGDRNAYIAEPHRCPGCEVMDQGQRDLDKARDEHEDLHGVTVRLVPNDGED